VQTSAEVLAQFTDGGPALTQHGQVLALHGWPDETLLSSLVVHAARNAGLETIPLPVHIRLRRRGSWWVFTNYGPESWTLPPGFRCLMGSQTLPPQGVTIAERAAP
jgi:beta-galactosidase